MAHIDWIDENKSLIFFISFPLESFPHFSVESLYGLDAAELHTDAWTVQCSLISFLIRHRPAVLQRVVHRQLIFHKSEHFFPIISSISCRFIHPCFIPRSDSIILPTIARDRQGRSGLSHFQQMARKKAEAQAQRLGEIRMVNRNKTKRFIRARIFRSDFFQDIS